MITRYDALNRPYEMDLPEGGTLAIGYDAVGNRQSITYPLSSGTLTTTYAYNALNRLGTITHATGAWTQVFDYDVGASGNRRQVTETRSGATRSVEWEYVCCARRSCRLNAQGLSGAGTP